MSDAHLLSASLEAARVSDVGRTSQTIVARIRPDNTTSIALFEGAGFRQTGTDLVAGVPCLVLALPR